MARQHVSIDMKKWIVKSLIFPTVLYGCETWTMTKKMEKKINACEMWIMDMEEDAKNIMDGEKDQLKCTHGDCNRRR